MLQRLGVFTDNTVGAYTDATLWSAIEPAVALICACLPSLPILGKFLADRLDGVWKRFGWRNRPKHESLPTVRSLHSERPRGPFNRLSEGARDAFATDDVYVKALELK